MNFNEVRQKYPEYDDLSDEDLAKGIHQKFYSDLPFEEFASKVGYGASKPNWLEGMGSYLLDEIKGSPERVLGTLSSIADVGAGLLSMPIGGLAKGTAGLATPVTGDTLEEASAKANQLIEPLQAPIGRAIDKSFGSNIQQNEAYKAIQFPFEQLTKYTIEEPSRMIGEATSNKDLQEGSKIALEMGLGLLPFGRRGNVNPTVDAGSTLAPRYETPKNYRKSTVDPMAEARRIAQEKEQQKAAEQQGGLPQEQLPLENRNPYLDPTKLRVDENGIPYNVEGSVDVARNMERLSPQDRLFDPREPIPPIVGTPELPIIGNRKQIKQAGKEVQPSTELGVTPRQEQGIPYAPQTDPAALVPELSGKIKEVREAERKVMEAEQRVKDYEKRASEAFVANADRIPFSERGELNNFDSAMLSMEARRALEDLNQAKNDLKEAQVKAEKLIRDLTTRNIEKTKSLKDFNELPPELRGQQELFGGFDIKRFTKDIGDLIAKLPKEDLRILRDRLIEEFNKLPPGSLTPNELNKLSENLGKVAAAIKDAPIKPPENPINPPVKEGKVIPFNFKKQGGGWLPFESSTPKKTLPGGVKSYDEFRAQLQKDGFSEKTILDTWLEMGGPRPDPIVKDPKVSAMTSGLPLSAKQKRAFDELGQRTRTYDEVKEQIKSEPDYQEGISSNLRGLVGLNEQAASTKYTGIRWAIGNMLSSVRKWENQTRELLFNSKTGAFIPIQKLMKLNPEAFADLWARQRATGNKEFAKDLTPEQQAVWNLRSKINDWVWENTVRIIEAAHPERIPDLAKIKKRVNYFNDNIQGAWTVIVRNKDQHIVKMTGEVSKAEAIKARDWLKENTKDLDGVVVEDVQFRPELNDLLKGKGMDKFDKTLAWEDLMDIGIETPEGKMIADRKAAYEQSLAWDYIQYKDRIKNKKDISIAPGNKPWKSKMDNAVEGWNHWLRHVENFAEWAGYQEGLLEIKKLLGDKDLADKPNLKKRIKQIVAQAFDEQPTLLGKAQETAIKNAAKYSGIDPGLIRAGAAEGRLAGIVWYLTTIKNLLVQEIQPAMVFPEWMQLLKNKYDLQGSTTLASATGAAVQAYIHFHDKGWYNTGELNLAKIRKAMGNDIADILEYGQRNGVLSSHILDKTELSLGEGAVKKGYNFLRDRGTTPLKFSDSVSRAGFYVGAVKFLEQAGMPREIALEFAANLDRLAMVDYNAYNIPNVYKKIGGEIGLQSAALSRFKHNQYWQYYFLGKEAPKAFGMLVASQFAVAGLLGLPLVQEVDSLWRLLQDWGMISADAPPISAQLIRSENVPTWASFGPLSYYSKYDFSTPLGNPNPIPDDPMKALLPMSSFYGDMLGGATDIVKGSITDNPTKIEQGALKLTPPQFKMGPEAAFFGKPAKEMEGFNFHMYDPKKPQNYVYTRDLGDMLARSTGGRSLDEALAMRQRVENRGEDMQVLERKKALGQKYMEIRRTVDGPSSVKLNKIKDEYLKLGGNWKELEEAFVKGGIVMEPDIKGLAGKATPDKMRKFNRAQEQGKLP